MIIFLSGILIQSIQLLIKGKNKLLRAFVFIKQKYYLMFRFLKREKKQTGQADGKYLRP